MIKTTHILKDSFSTYKSNFKKILLIALPIIILGVISEYYISLFSFMVQTSNFSNKLYLMISITIYILSILAISLYFAPVLNRVIQKKEDGGHFSLNLAYKFQTKNIFKWIMVNIWGLLYMIWFMLPYIAVNLLILVGVSAYGTIPKTVLLIILIIVGLIFATGIVLNITKFILYKNIFFSKNEVSARDTVRESIEFSKNKTKDKQIWKLIGIIFAFFVVSTILFSISTAIFAGLNTPANTNMLYFLENLIYNVISALFFLPIMSIVIAKGYVKIRE